MRHEKTGKKVTFDMKYKMYKFTEKNTIKKKVSPFFKKN